jgi:hypothetical protein
MSVYDKGISLSVWMHGTVTETVKKGQTLEMDTVQ